MVFSMRVSAQSLHNSFACSITVNVGQGRGEKIWFDYRYSNGELDLWVPTVHQTSKSVKKVAGFFNNHCHGLHQKTASICSNNSVY